jgi:hypothetical protein
MVQLPVGMSTRGAVAIVSPPSRPVRQACHEGAGCRYELSWLGLPSKPATHRQPTVNLPLPYLSLLFSPSRDEFAQGVSRQWLFQFRHGAVSVIASFVTEVIAALGVNH